MVTLRSRSESDLSINQVIWGFALPTKKSLRRSVFPKGIKYQEAGREVRRHEFLFEVDVLRLTKYMRLWRKFLEFFDAVMQGIW